MNNRKPYHNPRSLVHRSFNKKLRIALLSTSAETESIFIADYHSVIENVKPVLAFNTTNVAPDTEELRLLRHQSKRR